MKREIKCPHAQKCWMGGGSYDCAYDPPFCEEPELPRMVKEPEENKGGDEQADTTIQGELF